MYKPGMVQISEENEYGHWPYADPGNVYLPHSCNEWEIGGESEIEALIADLQGVLAKMRSPDYVKPVREEPEPLPPKPLREFTAEEKAEIQEYVDGGYSRRLALALVTMNAANKQVEEYYNAPSLFLGKFTKESK